MFWNNVKIALRNLRKNKAFAAINISGLAIGLTIYVFGGLLVNYERTHDDFFAKADQIYTIGAVASPDLNVGIDRFNSVQSALGPIIEEQLTDVEAVARTVQREFLVTMGPDQFYQNVFFSDPALMSIFDFEFVAGDSSAIEDPSAFIITEAAAIKYFGRSDVTGETITLDNEFDFYIGAVIADLPLNTHFNSSIVLDTALEIIAPVQALNRLREWDVAGNWSNLSIGNMTYVVLPAELDGAWLEAQLNAMFDRVVPEQATQAIASFTVAPRNLTRGISNCAILLRSGRFFVPQRSP